VEEFFFSYEMKDILMVVYPDLLGAEYHNSRQWNPEHLEFLSEELWDWDGPVVALLSGDTQAVQDYPEAYSLFVHFHILLQGCPGERELVGALEELDKIPLAGRGVTVTGIWSGENESVDTVYNLLKQKNVKVQISRHAIRKATVQSAPAHNL
jgi:hypothetical protein